MHIAYYFMMIFRLIRIQITYVDFCCVWFCAEGTEFAGEV